MILPEYAKMIESVLIKAHVNSQEFQNLERAVLEKFTGVRCRSTPIMKPEFIQAMLQFEEQQRINHWSTASFAAHKAFGELYETISELNDRFIETCMGCEGQSLDVTELTLRIGTQKVTQVAGIISHRDFINTEMMRSVRDADLINILADMAEACNKALYMLSLT